MPVYECRVLTKNEFFTAKELNQCPSCGKKLNLLNSTYAKSELYCPVCHLSIPLFMNFEEYERIERMREQIKKIPMVRRGIGRDRPGYHPEKDDPVKEIKADMKVLEEQMMETGNLKEYYNKKKALAYFAEANEEILR